MCLDTQLKIEKQDTVIGLDVSEADIHITEGKSRARQSGAGAGVTKSGTQVLVFCLLLIKWRKSGEVRHSSTEPFPEERLGAHGSVCRAFTRLSAPIKEQLAARTDERTPAAPPRLSLHNKRAKRRGKSRDSASSFRDFLIEGKAIPSGPHPHSLDYSSHYKEDENNSLLKATILFFFFFCVIYYFTENVPNILRKFKTKNVQLGNKHRP
ncbi:hypothetical protein MHYP_G00132110 [Metynnis hypsauchen]